MVPIPRPQEEIDAQDTKLKLVDLRRRLEHQSVVFEDDDYFEAVQDYMKWRGWYPYLCNQGLLDYGIDNFLIFGRWLCRRKKTEG